MNSGASLSADEQFRYHLWRDWSDDLFAPIRSTVFIMLNPSTADATDDDPTIRRCIGFARAWGCNRLDVINLFAYRAADPDDLVAMVKETGFCGDPENDLAIIRVLTDRRGDPVICAWGNRGDLANRDVEMMVMLRLIGIEATALHGAI